MTVHEPLTTLLRLRDGRFLEYAEFGDPRGTPVFYFHGFIGSCTQAYLAHASARQSGIRLIAPNRPGIGRSDPVRFRRMTEYAGDIEQLADALSLETFAIVGASGGGSFALAVTYALPERASLVGVAGCVGPLDVLQNLREMWWWRRTFLFVCNNHPRFSAVLFTLVFAACKRRPVFFYKFLSWMTSCASLTPRQRELIATVAWWDYRSVFLQKNGVQGVLSEVYLYFHWGFRMRDFPRETRALFWHSRDDQVAPFSVLQRMTGDVRRGRTIVCTGEHFLFLVRVRELMTSLKQELTLLPPVA